VKEVDSLNAEQLKQCSLCDCKVDYEAEGGLRGYIGILPVGFCPTCLSGLADMFEQLIELEQEWAQEMEKDGKVKNG